MSRTTRILVSAAALSAWAAAAVAQPAFVRARLAYGAPGSGPAVNFSPKGTQVKLTDVPSGVALPPGAVGPAKTGTIEIGPSQASWVRILVSADPDHPRDLCRLYVDRNRDGTFTDDGPAQTAVPATREKTGDSWSSFSRIELTVPYGTAAGASEPYMVAVWLVRQGDAAPDIARFSVSSWRAGTVEVNGVPALVAAMDSNNDAVFDASDTWSAIEASAPDAERRVLSIAEARPTSRSMFVKGPDREMVLEFRAFSPDGREVTFAVVDRPVTKAQDRAGDDALAAERPRPRATEKFPWETNFAAAQATATKEGRFLIVDFWTTWCGPCLQMDEWIWSDAEVAGVLRRSFVGVKVDGDLAKALVARFAVAGYPTIIVLDPAGKEVRRQVGYLSSKQILDWLPGKGRQNAE
jgi:thiol-disulfide isomerase/thioredoxin